ncbi:MAG: AAA family ATPase [Fusobacteriaceae bacterium]|jgi:AAA+ ATPase superfamily predicted ATPase|nr:AAA family ATPase [Fusobacteriaceae bacterium]
MEIIGRKQEIKALTSYMESGKPEFLAVYGRRRVGKTFLIKEFFRNRFAFYCTGRFDGSKEEQLQMFNIALNKYGKTPYPQKNDWLESFLQLEQLIKTAKSPGRKVIFIDEMPWLDTRASGFLSALEYFWNSFASARPDVFLIACGSATSWIVKKLFENTGGLFNRVTRRMALKPFTLAECEAFFHSRHIVLNRYQIVEAYMIFGGIPFYLDQFRPDYGLAQNVDFLCFGENAPLKDEYQVLYKTLFKNDENHRKIVTALAGKLSGLPREEIVSVANLPDGGTLTKVLDELESSGFIRKYHGYAKKSRGALYQLTDPFTLFWRRFLAEGGNNDAAFWAKSLSAGSQNAWRGYAFELVCLAHEEQIRKALGIAGVVANTSAWRSNGNGDYAPGAQIDLVIDRADHIINLCEIKYALREFAIDKSYAERLEAKIRAFAEETKTRKGLHMTFVTTYGVKRNQYAYLAQSEVTMQDLFG